MKNLFQFVVAFSTAILLAACGGNISGLLSKPDISNAGRSNAPRPIVAHISGAESIRSERLSLKPVCCCSYAPGTATVMRTISQDLDAP